MINLQFKTLESDRERLFYARHGRDAEEILKRGEIFFGYRLSRFYRIRLEVK